MKTRVKEQKGIEYYMDLPYSILLHEVDEEGEKYWITELPELPGCKSHGSSVEEAVKSVEEAKKDWILDSLKSGEEVPTPIERDRYSGRMLIRMARSLHRSLALIAEAEKLSLNQLIVTMLAKEAGRLSVLNRVEDKVDNLLQKIDYILEEKDVNIPFSKSIRLGQPQERDQFVISDTYTDAPVARALELIIEEAVKAQASEIQLKPEEDRLLIKFHIKGTLHDTLSLPLMMASPLISRIKILANMNIANHHPQEGLFHVRVGAINLECKVETTSTKYGEMVILHLSTATSSSVSSDIEKQVSDLLSKIV